VTAAPFAEELKEMLQDGRAEDATVAWFTRTSGGRFDARMRDLPWWPALVDTAQTLPDEMTLTGDGTIPPALEAVAVPTLLVYGEASPGWARSSAAALAAVLPASEVVGLPAQGHIVEFDAIAPVLDSFFRPGRRSERSRSRSRPMGDAVLDPDGEDRGGPDREDEQDQDPDHRDH
jgi:pimeloyl-ACP methyl ester carboxylesterase